MSALALAASGGAAASERVPPSSKKLALVLPESPDRLGVATEGLAAGVDSSEARYATKSLIAVVDPSSPDPDVDAVVARIRKGGLGLVVALGDGPSARALARVVPHMPETRFVFIDASVAELSLEGVPNAAAIRFSDEDAFDLGGYQSGLVPTMDGSQPRVDTVSIVAGEPTRDTARRIAGFKRGLRAARPGVKLRVDYSHELEDVTACENLANRQIDDGSDVVVALAGKCSRGALAVARFRNVWGIGAEEDGINFTNGVLMALVKDWTRATLFAIERLQEGTLAMGRDTVLGIEDDYIVGFEFSYRTPEPVMSAIIDRCSKIRASRHQDL